MKRQKRSAGTAGEGAPVSLAVLFVLAVLLPSVVLSILALRAADREALAVERKLEGALLSEVNSAAGAIAALLEKMTDDLEEEALSLPQGETALEEWKKRNPSVGIPFRLQGGVLLVPSKPDGTAGDFRRNFAPFLEGREALPVYRDITDVYRKQMEGETGAPFPDTGSRGMENEPAADPEKKEPLSRLAGRAPVSPGASSFMDGQERQMAASMMTSDSSLRKKTLKRAEEEGFQLLERNVVPQAQSLPGPESGGEPSVTLSRSRTFRELLSEERRGMLPHLSGEGLLILFWCRVPGGAVGCTLAPGDLRERISGALPEILSKVRILTVLDHRGGPLLAPNVAPVPDWRRPFVSREISPILPMWEVGAWLADPSLAVSQARFATIAVWVLVAVLIVVIAAGGFTVLRALSAEMRLARQKTTFVANVSHELKTPLTSIRLFAEMLLHRRQQDEKRREEYLRIMVSEAERLTRLVENVLAFSRKGGGACYAMELLDLGEVARKEVSRLEPHLENGGFSVSFAAEGPIPVRGNGEALGQVLVNLLSNAEKYSGEIRSIQVKAFSRGGEAVVEIADRGIGVPKGQGERIFEEFFRCDESLAASRSGTGLGLPIARDIARRHGGDVSYFPRDGGGSVFSLLLPLADDGLKGGGI